MAKYLDSTGLQHFWDKIKAYVDARGGASLEDVYPVGSIYLNASDSTNPATLLGFGTWERLGQGRMMIDADTTYTAGGTGGSATHDHGGNTGSTTLTAAQSALPEHTHGFTNPKIPNHVHTMTHGHSFTQPTITTKYNSKVVKSGTDLPNQASAGSHTETTSTSASGGKVTNYTGNTGNPTALEQTTGGKVLSEGTATASSGHDHTISSASNMPPWIGVYMWTRTA